MTAGEIRKLFLNFFEEKQHTVLPSSSLIPADPSILLNIAGMVPFKDYFLGKEQAPFHRAATCQKCVRTSDIERVGFTARHHTFFEMLGNFSFGDYFKRDAIKFAWEFLTEVLKIPKEKLKVSIFLDDDEAYNIWHNEVGLNESDIYRLGEEHNFWSSGPTGPCGPDSEIFYDFGPDTGCGQADCNPSHDCGRFLEVWNLVFMQFDRDADGVLTPLPKKNIDTGMGLERLASVIQGHESNFEIDSIYPIIEYYEKLSGHSYMDAQAKISLRVIADHIRAAMFLISDGVTPSNEGRGYVLKRIIRRAVIFGKKIGFTEPFLFNSIPLAVKLQKEAYPELSDNEQNIMLIIKNEEERFFDTITAGINYLENEISSAGAKNLSGAIVFKLYDTYGFPAELTEEILEERGLNYDKAGYEKALSEQRQRGKDAFKGYKRVADSVAKSKGVDLAGLPPTKFVGYDELSCKTHILGIFNAEGRAAGARQDEQVSILLEQSPFYAESGGQVGDIGTIKGSKSLFKVKDVQKLQGKYWLHIGVLEEGAVNTGDECFAEVDGFNRRQIAANHTATHLLHKILRDILGKHVHQAGSLVAADYFRFDFNHFEKLSDYQINEIIMRMHGYIYRKLPVSVKIMNINEARKTGAMALFDEKYTENVRVVSIQDTSKEFCGGTHLDNTIDIGVFTIRSVSNIGAGLKRIEATTGYKAALFLNKEKAIIDNVRRTLNSRDDIEQKISSLLEQNKKMNKQIQHLATAAETKETVETVNGIRFINSKFKGLTPTQLRAASDRVFNANNEKTVLFFVSDNGEKTLCLMRVSKDISQKYNASAILGKVLKAYNGRGGGKQDLAQGGGQGIEFNSIVNAVKGEL